MTGRHRRPKTKRYTYGPGVMVAAIFVATVFVFGGDVGSWWVFWTAIGTFTVIDIAYNVRSYEVPRVKTDTEYYRE